MKNEIIRQGGEDGEKESRRRPPPSTRPQSGADDEQWSDAGDCSSSSSGREEEEEESDTEARNGSAAVTDSGGASADGGDEARGLRQRRPGTAHLPPPQPSPSELPHHLQAPRGGLTEAALSRLLSVAPSLLEELSRTTLSLNLSVEGLSSLLLLRAGAECGGAESGAARTVGASAAEGEEAVS